MKSDVGILYRSHSDYGLQLTAVSTHFKKVQVNRCHLLQSSRDPDIVTLYNQKASRDAQLHHQWSGSSSLVPVMAQVTFEHHFQGQSDRPGLGHSRYDWEPLSPSDEREACSQVGHELGH